MAHLDTSVMLPKRRNMQSTGHGQKALLIHRPNQNIPKAGEFVPPKDSKKKTLNVQNRMIPDEGGSTMNLGMFQHKLSLLLSSK